MTCSVGAALAFEIALARPEPVGLLVKGPTTAHCPASYRAVRTYMPRMHLYLSYPMNELGKKNKEYSSIEYKFRFHVVNFLLAWTTWSVGSCNVSCGPGQRLRQRSCIHQSTADNGTTVFYSDNVTEPCIGECWPLECFIKVL